MSLKRGIALAGGGARGAYQIGALKALKIHGYLDDIHAISGVSVGSLNACLLAMDALDEAEELWLNLKEDSLFTKDASWLNMLVKENVKLITDGAFKTDKLEIIMDEMLDFEVLRKKDIYIALSFVAEKKHSLTEAIKTNIKNLFEREKHIEYRNLKGMDDQQIHANLIASCALPVAFKPVEIEGKTYLDGGLLDNTPYKPLIDAGCDEVIVIDLFRFSLKNMRRKDSIDGVKMNYIYPKKNLHGILDFKKEHLQARFDLGYNDAEEAIKTWKQKTE